MKLFFEDNIECTQLVLRIIMQKNDLIVKSVKTHKYFEGIEGKRSISLDVYAVDSQGLEYDIEIQRANAGASPKRARFYSALIDAHMLEPKDPFDKMHECFVIFITENDVLGEGLPLYSVERYINGKRIFNDGSKILYVNASHQDAGTELGKLMHDFMCTHADEMFYDELAARAKYFKGDEKGESLMKSVWDEMQEEKLAEGERKMQENIVRMMLKVGKLAFNEIAEYTGLELARVQEIAKALA